MKHRFILFLLLISSFCFAQIEEYFFTREIEGIENQWHKIVLPNSMFNNLSNNLSDIRIYGQTSAGKVVEAPYILNISKSRPVKTQVRFNLINTSSNSSGYFYTFKISEKMILNQIDLKFDNENFDWTLDLEGSQNQQDWFMLTKDYRIVAIKNEHTDYQFTKITFPASNFSYLRIRITADQKPEFNAAELSQYRIEKGNYRKYAIPSHETSINEKTRETVINLKLANRLPVSRLKIDVRDDFDYYRPIHIEYLTDSIKTEKGWKYRYRNLHSATLTSLESGKLTFPTTLLQRLRIRIGNQRNQPLTIGAISAEGPVHSITARFTEPARYVMAYGNPGVARPQYDIVRFKNTIPADLEELTLGPEKEQIREKEPDTEPLFGNPLWLWGIMLVIVAILGWFSMKMLKNEGAQ